MTDFVIEIAQHLIGISVLYPQTREFCDAFLSDGFAEFSVTVTREDIDREREIRLRTDTAEGRFPQNHTDTYLETIALQRKLAEELFSRDILLFHGSTVAVDGQAYLFTAKSGTGKSTHTRLWRELLGERAVMVNDDKPFLKITPEGGLACGSPWNGKHRLGSNIMVPLKAICILERDGNNAIRSISAQEALPVLFQQSNRPCNPGMIAKYMELIDGLTKRCAFYRLQCTMDPEAAVVSYEAMSGKKYERMTNM